MATIAGVLGVLLAFSSMALSWYILMPHKRPQAQHDKH